MACAMTIQVEEDPDIDLNATVAANIGPIVIVLIVAVAGRRFW